MQGSDSGSENKYFDDDFMKKGESQEEVNPDNIFLDFEEEPHPQYKVDLDKCKQFALK